jgi:predicted amidohydrolase YtcJ
VEDLSVTLFHNCKILTMDPNDSEVEAMAIFAGKIIAVGTESSVRHEAKKFIQEYSHSSGNAITLVEEDLKGACVVPGFIDAHLHPALYIYFKTQLNLAGIHGYSELREVLKRENAARRPGEWIFGIDLMEDTFRDPAERHFPGRRILDSFCSDRPVLLLRHDGHICGVNSAALKIIGINRHNAKQKTPPTGEIRLDETGEPTGIFTETATALAIDRAPPPSLERIREGCKEFSEELKSYGITTCGGVLQTDEKGPAGKSGAMELPLMQMLIKERLIEQDFVFYLITDSPEKLKQHGRSFKALNDIDEKYSVAGIKLFVDGTFGASTAYMFEPFSDSTERRTGMLVSEEDDLRRLVKETNAQGYQVACHSIGDRANRVLVNLYREAFDAPHHQSTRFRIEHASTLTDDTIVDAAKLGIVFVCQPAFIDSEHTWLEKRLGSERCEHTYPFRTIIDAGVVLAGASDAPVESANVMKAIHACVTRDGFVPRQSITVTEALRMFTCNGAYALGEERIKGSLEKDKLADFVVLDEDPRRVAPERLTKVRIRATFRRGKRIYASYSRSSTNSNKKTKEVQEMNDR